MFSITTRTLFIYSFAFVLFLFHAFADARLIRGGGRGTHLDSSNTIYTLVDDGFRNSVGLEPGYVPIQENRFNSGSDELISTPEECEALFGSLDDLNAAIQFEGFVDEPCYYEFYENDSKLEFSGFGRGLFDMAAGADVTWTLSRAGFSDIIINDSINSIVGNQVLLDTLMPPALVPGEYLIDLDITFFSGPDSTFYRAQGDSLGDQDCEEVTPGVVECRLRDFFGSDTLSFSSAYKERLVILPGSAPRVPVSEPAMLGLFLISLIGFRVRKKLL